MLPFDSAQIQSRARIEALLAEAEQERLLRSLRRPAPGGHRLRGRLAVTFYALALRLDPLLAEDLRVRPCSLTVR